MEFLPWETHRMIIKAVTGGREIFESVAPRLPAGSPSLQQPGTAEGADRH